MPRLFTVIILLLMLTALCTSVSAQAKDYSSKGPEFAPLRDIRLSATRVDSVGMQEISVEGYLLKASSFKIATKEPAPFLEGNSPYNNVIKDIEIQYELLVADDIQYRVHDKLIDVLKEISQMPAEQRDFSQVGLIGERGRYLIFSGPVATPNYVWFDGRIVVARFLAMRDKRRDRALTTESFWKEKIRFFSNGHKVSLEGIKKSFADDFLKRLAAGDFKRPEQ